MKTFSQSLKRQDGFTLVELMVVVAIIGLLSAVAIPNFKKYQAKSKMSEAKLQLSALYTAETSFYSDYNMYAQCLAFMGFDPNLEVFGRYFAVGFDTPVAIDATAHNSAVSGGLDALACPAQATTAVAPAVFGTPPVASANDAYFFPAGKGIGAAIASDTTWLPPTAFGDQSGAGNMTFTAGAGGVVAVENNGGAITGNSHLTIDESKMIRIVRNGY